MTQTERKSVITHPANSFHIELHKDYLLLCQDCAYKKGGDSKKSKSSPYCKALILSILECWTNNKEPGEAIYMTNPQWIDAMYGMFSRCVIMDSLEEVTQEGLITRTAYLFKGRSSYAYTLNAEKINNRLVAIGLKIDASKNRRVVSTNRPIEPVLPSKNRHDASKSKPLLESSIDYDYSDSTQHQREHSDVASADITPSLESENVKTLLPDAIPQSDTFSKHFARLATPEQATEETPVVDEHPIASDTPTEASKQNVSVPPTPPVKPAVKPAQTRGKKPTTPSQQSLMDSTPSGPPQTPAVDAAWPDAVTMVEFVEARHGKRYRDSKRLKELSEARAILKDDPQLTRSQFEQAFDKRNDAWWIEHNGPLTVADLRTNDRLHTLIELIEAQKKPAKPPTGGQPKPSNILSPEQLERNRQRKREKIAEMKRQEAEKAENRALQAV